MVRMHAQPTPFIGIVPIHLCYVVHNTVGKITAGGRKEKNCCSFLANASLGAEQDPYSVLTNGDVLR